MATVTYDPTGIKTFVTEIETKINEELGGYIGDFNESISNLNTPTAWKGGSSYTTISNLISCYTSYIGAYNKLNNYLREMISEITQKYQKVYSIIGNYDISSTNINVKNFEPIEVNSALQSSVEYSNTDILETVAGELETAVTNIREVFGSISTAFQKIGVGSTIFDTTGTKEDVAEVFKNKVVSYIKELDNQYDSESLNTCITNVKTAAGLIKS